MKNLLKDLAAEAKGKGDSEESPELDAAKDAIAAVKAGDAKALSLALKRHYEACYGDEESDDAEE